jgi:HEAT repeat protein
MKRMLFLLLAASLAAQQGAAEVARALDPQTAPSERTRLLAEIAKTPEGRLELARRGLAPELDSEVVHAVVEVLLAGEEPGEHMEPICRLLLSPAHRAKVQQRIQRVAESPAIAKRLVERLTALARGGTPESAREPALRTATVRALGSVPARAAVESIVAVWSTDADPYVRDECRASVDGVIDAPTAAAAEAYLAERPYATYFDLVKEVSRRRVQESEAMTRIVGQLLRTAEASVAIELLANRSGELRRAAAERIQGCAAAGPKDGLIAGMKAEEFALAVFGHFRAELGRGESVATVSILGETLATLAEAGPNGPLLRSVPVEDLTRAVQDLADRKADWQSAGEAAVRLLGALGEPGQGVLMRFARGSGSAEVRRRAAFQLGELARNVPTTQAFVGQGLADLLLREADPRVRQQILLSLGSAPVEDAVEPIRALLFPEKADEPAALTELEPRYCIEVLARIETPAALDVLVRLTKEADPEVRALAAVTGLVPRVNGRPDHEAVREHLRQMVVGPDQPEEVRRKVVAGLGESNRRGADAILREAARAGELDPELRALAVTARLRLAERLADPDAAQEDLDAANAILREEWAAGNRERIEPIARAILEAGDAAKKRVGDARALVALLEREQRGAELRSEDVDALLPLFTEARDKSVADRPTPLVERQLLLELRVLLKATSNGQRPYIDASKRLAALAAEDRQQAWGYWLDAIGCAAGEVKDRALAEGLVTEMRGAAGDPEGAAIARWQTMQASIAQLPAAGKPQ